jgi:hypothetical protein
MMVKVITTELLQVNGFTFIITRPFQEFRKSITIGRRKPGRNWKAWQEKFSGARKADSVEKSRFASSNRTT